MFEDKDLKFRTKKFALSIVYLFRDLPSAYEFKVIGNQLLRSGTSVGANTRAAFRARSDKEFVAKIGIVIEEADESNFWLEMLEELTEATNHKITELKKESNELTAIFTAISKKVKSRA
jgi:four helix bundle protein